MDKLIETLLKFMPFSSWLEQLGLSEESSAGLSMAILALLVWLLSWGTKTLYQRHINLMTARNLEPQFDYQSVRRATQYFIPTQFQNISPARQDEPGFTHQYISRNPLIPFFNKTAFNKKIDSERFYLILGDSGMGKTTFMINLYIQYHAFFNIHRKNKMRLFRFYHPDTLREIKSIKPEEAKNTILLLDGLDEDPNIVSKDPNISEAQAFENRVDEIIEATRNFCDVVITCRTQYFPGQEDDPYEVKVRRPDEKGFFTLNKLYLSPFTDKEVGIYLNKKYGRLKFWNFRKKRRAARIVKKSHHLVVRPMLLSYIDYLEGDSHGFKSTYEIYEVLIDKWLNREAEKRKYINDRKTFISNLHELSHQTAITIYHNWQTKKYQYLTKEEAINIATQNHIELKPEEVTGQSLLTCDGAGNWKFAHKSILEFFLAREASKNSDFLRTFQFAGMDMVKHFLGEGKPIDFVFVEGGTFTMGDPECNAVLHDVYVDHFYMCKYPVTKGEYEKVTGRVRPLFPIESKKNPITHVSWLDAIKYCNLLNQNHGYTAVYDSEGNLLDEFGEITLDVTKVHGFRLPTEAEWEYAARGGKLSRGHKYSGSNEISEVGWCDTNSDKKVHPVGVLKPNELGLYDMSGNVWEWCQDKYYRDYYNECRIKGIVRNPLERVWKFSFISHLSLARFIWQLAHKIQFSELSTVRS